MRPSSVPPLVALMFGMAFAQRVPLTHEYAPNLTPYGRLCATIAVVDDRRPAVEVDRLHGSMWVTAAAVDLPVLHPDRPECAPMRLKASGSDVVLFVEVARGERTTDPWALRVRVLDPHLLGANGNVYQAVLWERLQDTGPNTEAVVRDLRGALTQLAGAWRASRSP